MKRGEHPNSLANLGARPTLFGTKKKPRNVSMTEEGWEKLFYLAKSQGCKSVSEFLEKLSRGEVKIA